MTRHFGKRLKKRLQRHYFRPRISVRKGLPLRRLGTDYGGWTFVNSQSLHGSTILSCGLGEDASFDVNFIHEYSASVIVVDPTPRAIDHYFSMARNFGSPPLTASRSNHGCLDPASYDLTNIDEQSLQLVPFAVASQSGMVKFFAPPNPSHVSYSLINFQNNYATTTEFIEVEAVTLSSLVSKVGDVRLIKLDIEGAEAEVIPELLRSGARPSQILVEFDEMNRPSRRSRSRAEATDSCLRENGYECVFHDGRSTFCYLKTD